MPPGIWFRQVSKALAKKGIVLHFVISCNLSKNLFD